MPRNASPAVLAAMTSGAVRPALFLQINFLTDVVLMWGGYGSVTPPGPAYDPSSAFPYQQTFQGAGWMGKIEAVPEVADAVAQNLTLVLAGIPVELVTDAISSVRQDSAATLWLGFFDESNNLLADPIQIYQGSCDVPTITEGAETCTISITVENPLIDLHRAPERLYTDIDQQFIYPGDTGFAQVQLLQDYLVTWPSPVPQNGGTDTTPPPLTLTIQPGQTQPVPVRTGQTVQLTATEERTDGAMVIVMGTGNGNGDNWGGIVYSSDPSIATVDGNGLVTGVAQGFCVITKRFSQSVFLGGGANKPSNTVTASVTIQVTE
jgi:hypothetical protein